MKSLAQMQAEVVEFCVAKGWSGPGAPAKTFGDCMALLHSEVSEAVEAFRSWGVADATTPLRRCNGSGWIDNGPTSSPDHCPGCRECTGVDSPPKPEGVGSEFADVLIRLLDDCDRWGIDLAAEYERKMAYNRTRSFRHGGRAL